MSYVGLEKANKLDKSLETLEFGRLIRSSSKGYRTRTRPYSVVSCFAKSGHPPASFPHQTRGVPSATECSNGTRHLRTKKSLIESNAGSCSTAISTNRRPHLLPKNRRPLLYSFFLTDGYPHTHAFSNARSSPSSLPTAARRFSSRCPPLAPDDACRHRNRYR